MYEVHVWLQGKMLLFERVQLHIMYFASHLFMETLLKKKILY